MTIYEVEYGFLKGRALIDAENYKEALISAQHLLENEFPAVWEKYFESIGNTELDIENIHEADPDNIDIPIYKKEN